MAFRLKDMLLPALIEMFLQYSQLFMRRHTSCQLHAHDMCSLHPRHVIS